MIEKRHDLRLIAQSVILVIGAVLLLGGTALAQGRDDVRGQLERTDELIESARNLISESGSISGNAVLDQAIRHQNSAWEAFNRGHWGQAWMLTERARNELYRALGNIRQSENNESEVERQLERTDVILDEARDRLGSHPAIGMRRAVDMAVTTQRRAWDLYRERNLRPALRLTLEARQMVLRFSDKATGGPGGGQLDDITFNIRMEQLQQALERVETRLGNTDNTAAHQHVENARRMLEEARQSYGNGENTRADRALKDARRELERAMRLVVADVRADEITALVETAEERLDLLRAPVMQAGDTQLQTWLNQAAENLVQAREALNLGRNQRALYLTRTAVDRLNRIADEVQP
ncbi:MAG: hypothetical protein Kow0074_11690 [Candidatus Zixiibacteriota bacterium]